MADLIYRESVLPILAGLARTQGEYDASYDKLMQIPSASRWIPCSDRLPENRERVLVCFRSGTVHIAVWYGDYDEKGAWKVTSQFPTKLYRTDTIPKWMPMPEPPEVYKYD